MTREKFINKVIDELTEGKSIPASPKLERISTIINNTKQKFYEFDDRSNQFFFIVIDSKYFETPLFKSYRKIKMPDCVVAIEKLSTLGSKFESYNINPDYQKTNLIYMSALSGNPRDLVTGVVNTFYQDFLQDFIVKDISFEFSQYTHELTIRGRDMNQNCIAHCHIQLPEEALFEMDQFFEYVVGKCKQSFVNIMGFVKGKQIGGYEIDTENIKEEGKALITKIEAQWKEDQNNVAFFEEF
jgi:hypothetical protein